MKLVETSKRNEPQFLNYIRMRYSANDFKRVLKRIYNKASKGRFWKTNGRTFKIFSNKNFRNSLLHNYRMKIYFRNFGIKLYNLKLNLDKELYIYLYFFSLKY